MPITQHMRNADQIEQGSKGKGGKRPEGGEKWRFKRKEILSTQYIIHDISSYIPTYATDKCIITLHSRNYLIAKKAVYCITKMST